MAGGVGDYRTAMHLMRTGAAGVIVGYGESSATTTDAVLGIGVPMATAIVDAAAARRDYLDETGGRYVHVIADGGIDHSGDLAKAIACGADAVMLGEQLTDVADAPGRGLYWTSAAAHPSLPRSEVSGFGEFVSHYHLGDPQDTRDAWNPFRRRERLYQAVREMQVLAAPDAEQQAIGHRGHSAPPQN